MTYYKTIDGYKYDGVLLEVADGIIQSNGGVIGDDGVDVLLKEYYTSGDITETSERTIRYIKDNFNWEDEALITFNTFLI